MTEAPSEDFVSADIRVSVMEPITFSDLTPLLDDLSERFLNVTATRTNMRPPMAGALDVVIALVVVYAGVVSIEFVKKFAGMLAEDSYTALRDRLRRLRDKADEVAQDRVWTLTMQIGSHPFHFRGPMDDEEFRRRLRAAQEILDRGPDRLIAEQQLPHEMEPGWYWHEDHWEATPLLAEWMEGRSQPPQDGA